MNFNSENRYLMALCAVLLVKSFLMILVILHAGIGLGPDEAQYWTWSQYLDWGYYSKPPAIAWQIWLGTHLFGNTELGVRFMSVVLGFLLSLSTYWLGLKCNLQARTAFWAAVAMAFTPVGVMGSLLAITDGGQVLFWTLASVCMASALAKRQAPDYVLLGLCIFCGALFKWPMYLFWALVVGFIPFFRFLFSPMIFVGILISLLGLFPSIIWNSTHQWVTFRHVFSTVSGGHGHASAHTQSVVHGNLGEFWVTQMALLSPILFVIFVCALVYLLRFRRSISPPLLFCGVSSLAILLGYSVLAVFQKIQGNWCDFIYPTAIIFLTWYAFEVTRYGRVWFKLGIALSIVLCAVALSIPKIQSEGIFDQYQIQIPYKFNPFRHNMGWDRLSSTLTKAGYNPAKDFLFSDKYQMSSILSFYGPEQKRAYFLNLQGTRKNQFSFWPGMSAEQLGNSGYFVYSENSPHLEKDLSGRIDFYQKELQKYFKEVRFVGLSPLFNSYGVMSKGALVFYCVGYNGQEPESPELY